MFATGPRRPKGLEFVCILGHDGHVRNNSGFIREPWPFHGTAEDDELLPKSDILRSQLATSLEAGDESGNQRRNHAGMVLADRRLFKFGACG